jgi:hypothetical protein
MDAVVHDYLLLLNICYSSHNKHSLTIELEDDSKSGEEAIGQAIYSTTKRSSVRHTIDRKNLSGRSHNHPYHHVRDDYNFAPNMLDIYQRFLFLT